MHSCRSPCFLNVWNISPSDIWGCRNCPMFWTVAFLKAVLPCWQWVPVTRRCCLPPSVFRSGEEAQTDKVSRYLRCCYFKSYGACFVFQDPRVQYGGPFISMDTSKKNNNTILIPPRQAARLHERKQKGQRAWPEVVLNINFLLGLASGSHFFKEKKTLKTIFRQIIAHTWFFMCTELQ